MKKTAIILLLILTLIPFKVNAASNKNSNKNQDILQHINFDDIEEEILKRNPTVKMNENTLASLRANLDMLEDNAEDAEDVLDGFDNNPDIKRQLEAEIQRLEQEKAELATTLVSYPELLPVLESQYNTLIGIYRSNLLNLEASLGSSKNALKSQSKMLDEKVEDMEDTIDKFIQQSKMTSMQLSWAAENLYITYNTLDMQEAELSNNLKLLEKQIEIAKIRESLGLASKVDVLNAEISLRELQISQKALKTQKEAIKGELNLLFGQAFDEDLLIGAVPVLEERELLNIDYDADLSTALNNNFSLKLQVLERKSKDTALERAEKDSSLSEEAAEFDYENEEIKLGDLRKQTALAFYKIFEELLSKKQTYALENAKYELAETMKEQVELKYRLGMLSDIGRETELNNYFSKMIKKYISGYELTLSYRKYEWMKRGLTL